MKHHAIKLTIAILIMFEIFVFYFANAFTDVINTCVIKNEGKILHGALPLHVDGKYIKNSLNHTVMLRGVVKTTFEDDPDGIWMGSTYWEDENVKAELDAMREWGVNVIDCHIAIELLKFDIGPDSGHPSSPYCSISAREAIRRLLSFAAERGMYVILGGYSVRSYFTGGAQDPLPFPPYQESENASEIIGSMEEFAEFWGEMASEYRNYPNVIFELWNEPTTGGLADWRVAVGLCIDAIRSAGFTGIIDVALHAGPYCAVYEDEYGNPVPAYGETLQPLATLMEEVIQEHDPIGNVIYCTHIYGSEGCTGLYTEPELIEKWGSIYVWNYTHMKAVFEYFGFRFITENISRPLRIGEFGLRLSWRDSGDMAQHQLEILRYTNQLKLFKEFGLHYTAFWWRNTGIYRLLKYGEPWVPPPEESGEILITALKGEI